MLKLFTWLDRFLKAYRRQKIAMGSLVVVTMMLIIGLLVPILPIPSPFSISSKILEPPSVENPLGTDVLGRSVLSRLIFGIGATFLVGFVSAGTSMTIGVILGALAGYHGGWLDDLLRMVTEIFLVFPLFFFLILFVSLFGRSIIITSLGIGLVAWPRTARIMRSQVVSLKTKGFVLSSVCMGMSSFRIIFKHIIPNGIAPVIVNTMIIMTYAILTEAGLSFLGLGDPNVISWGGMIKDGYECFATAWWLVAFPGIAMALLTSTLNFIAEGINRVLGTE